jgi:hypothetical protein
MIKLKNLMNESMGLGDLPSTKLMKMKMTLSELEASEKVESVINESPSSEELRIVLMAIKKIAKYRSVPIDQAVNDVINAAEQLGRDIKKGKIK